MAKPLQWQSTSGFLFAAIGFAVGLGNLWRFPYVVGEHGGGAFVLVYLAFALGIGLPLVMAELAIGRRGQGSPPRALASVANSSRVSDRWRWLGYLQLLAAGLVLIVYLVVTGWVLAYLFEAVRTGFSVDSLEVARDRFTQLQASPRTVAAWSLLALLLPTIVLLAGAVQGIERVARWLVPIFVLLLVGLAVFNAWHFGLESTIRYLFVTHDGSIDAELLLAALGQSLLFARNRACRLADLWFAPLRRGLHSPHVPGACACRYCDCAARRAGGFSLGLRPGGRPGKRAGPGLRNAHRRFCPVA